MPRFNNGDYVSWNWGAGEGIGQITETFTDRVTKTIKSAEITRNATPDNPAYLIVTDNGKTVLKSERELTKA